MSPAVPGSTRRLLLAAFLLLAVAAPAAIGATPADVAWRFEPLAQSAPGVPPTLGAGAIPFVLDDGSAEGSFGVSDAGSSNAKQFLWFNQFALSGDAVLLEEIHVLFPPGANMAVGNAIQLVVYHDADADPANGATLLASHDEVIQAVDGTTFSTYPLSPRITIPPGGNLLVGVVSRFVVSGVTGPTNPAALDTSASQGRSWVAIWNADPPEPPTLPPDQFIDRVDVFVAGNWLIRASASSGAAAAVPGLGAWGMALLVLLLAGVAVMRLGRS